MLSIDLNCDMGEGIGNDAAIMPYVSAVNIACGFHAGDEATVKQTIKLALQHHVAIGAHPGFDDRENFGRLELQLTNEEVYNLVFKQVMIVQNIAASFHTKLHHVKPHGALYNIAANNSGMSAAIAKAVKDIDETLVLYGLNNSYLISEAQKVGLATASEVFADRRYNADGSLVGRTKAGALIEDENMAIQQVLNMVLRSQVISIDNRQVNVNAQTICIHGDGNNAVAFAKKIHETLGKNDIIIKTV